MIGTSIAHYRILEKIGGGGMGVVYKAEDIRLGRLVALKFLPDEFASDPQILERFRREARAISALNHPNICTLYDIGEADGRTFLVMEFLEGQNLREIIREQGALPLTQLLRVATDVAEALEVAHHKGILHRDIKPANIFVNHWGKSKLLDFGIAKIGGFKRAVAADQAGTHGSTVDTAFTGGGALGTIAYMSPEQALGKPLDERTDLFSFGTVLYEMTTGIVPFHGNSTGALFLSVIQETPLPAVQLKPGLPEALQRIILKCLEKDKENRYRTATEVLQDLRELQRTLSGEAPPPPPAAMSFPGKAQNKDGSHASESVGAVASRPKRIGKLLIAGAVMALLAMAIFYLVKSRSPAPMLTEKDTIILAEFTNTTGESIFDESLNQAVRLDLEQSPFLNVASDRQVRDVLKLMERPANQRLTTNVAREVCLRSNSKVFVAGSIGKSADGYLIGLTATSCSTGKEISKVEIASAEKSKVVQSLGKADDQLRHKLGESLASLEKFSRPLAEATTSSLEALQAFTEGESRYKLNSMSESIPYFQRAIELDPNFAKAYSRLASAYYSTGQQLPAMENHRRAYELRNRVSQRERFSIAGNYLRRVTGQLPECMEISQEWVRAYPKDETARSYLGLNYYSLGKYDLASQAFLKAIEMAPAQVQPYVNGIMAFKNQNKYDEAKALFNAARSRGLDNERMRTARYEIAFLEGDSAGMQEQTRFAEGKKALEDRMLALQATVEAYYGRYAKSREIVEKSKAVALREGAEERAITSDVVAAFRDALVGNKRSAQKIADKILRAGGLSESTTAVLSFIMAQVGDNTTAEHLLDQLVRDRPLDTATRKLTVPTVRALIELNKNNPDEAIRILQDALPYELASGHLGGLEPAYVRGLAYLQAKRGREAASEFQKLIDHPGLLGPSTEGPLARVQMARATAMSGDREAALQQYQDFFALWKDADPDISILKEAKTEYAKLK